MAQQAQVTSIEAINEFRSQLINYLEKAQGAVEDAAEQIVRTRVWLQSDQRSYWEAEIRRRTKALEMAQQELFSARASELVEGAALKQMAVNRARQRLEEAQDRLKRLKNWSRRYDNEVGLPGRSVDRLRTYFSNDMRKAVAHLAQIITTLETYAERSSSQPSQSPTPGVESSDPAAPATSPSEDRQAGEDRS